MKEKHDGVLGIHPTRTGFGWVLFEGPNNPIDWGVAAVSGDRAAECLKRIDALMDDYKPREMVLEKFDGAASRRSEWVRQFGQDVLDLAGAKGMDAHVYSLSDIKTRFAEIGATSRYKIATEIASLIEAFAHELPPKRKIWLPENSRIGIFNAAAVVLTHYWMTASVD